MARCEKIEVSANRAVFQGWNFKQDKGVFRASTDSPKHTDRQRRSGIFKGVIYLKLCYCLYSELPDFADFKRFFLNTPSVTERKDEKWTTTQRE